MLLAVLVAGPSEAPINGHLLIFSWQRCRSAAYTGSVM